MFIHTAVMKACFVAEPVVAARATSFFGRAESACPSGLVNEYHVDYRSTDAHRYSLALTQLPRDTSASGSDGTSPAGYK